MPNSTVAILRYFYKCTRWKEWISGYHQRCFNRWRPNGRMNCIPQPTRSNDDTGHMYTSEHSFVSFVYFPEAGISMEILAHCKTVYIISTTRTKNNNHVISTLISPCLIWGIQSLVPLLLPSTSTGLLLDVARLSPSCPKSPAPQPQDLRNPSVDRKVCFKSAILHFLVPNSDILWRVQG